MHYTVYKTTNTINGKIYIGCHKTKDLDDGYIGSGKYLHYAIEKYGIENFEKEILAVFDKASDMFEMESELVNEDFVKDKTNYNLKLGGEGGWDVLNQHTEKNKKNKMKSGKIGGEKWWSKPENREKHRKELSERSKRLHKEGIFRYANFTGKRHDETSKRKIGEANSKHQMGQGNSQFGTMWIYNSELKESKKIKKSDPIPEGWVKGRKIKS